MRSPGNPPPKAPFRNGGLADGGLRIGVRELVPEPEPPPREPAPPPRLATRTDAECRELARRQRAGEDLGLSDAFVEEWG